MRRLNWRFIIEWTLLLGQSVLAIHGIMNLDATGYPIGKSVAMALSVLGAVLLLVLVTPARAQLARRLFTR